MKEVGPSPASDTSEDGRLLELVAKGDAEALGALYDRHGTACYRIALAVTTSAALAEEVVQEVFLAAWQRHTYRPSSGTARSFLCALAHHKAVDAVRRESALQRREHTYGAREQPTNHDQPEDELTARLRDGEVREALLALTPVQREALVLAYFGGRNQREIAVLTGVPLGTVKTRMFSGMRRLQSLLSRRPVEEGSP